MGLMEIIAILTLFVAVVALFISTRKDRISLEVRIAEVSRDMVALNEKVNTGLAQKAELIENVRLSTISMVSALVEQFNANAANNREDHGAIVSKIDDLKDILINMGIRK